VSKKIADWEVRMMVNPDDDRESSAPSELPEARRASDIIAAARSGATPALNALIGLIYPELKKRARWLMVRERQGHTFGPSGSELVQRVLEKVIEGKQVFHAINTEEELIRLLTQRMRFILVDYARAARTHGKPSPRSRVPFEDVEKWAAVANVNVAEVLSVHEVLSLLEKEDAPAAAALELRLFAGLTNEEAAGAMGLSVATFRRTLACGTVFVRQALTTPPAIRGVTGDSRYPAAR
jgi:DNA-directed RNA polymerase specialized sigma24 family protein